jgi:hypothetical protein
MGIEQFEQRLERLVEGTVAKAFRGQLQPVEIGKRVKREMDLHCIVSIRGRVAPNSFEIDISEEDFERFGSFLDVLAGELVEGAQEHGRESRYKFLGPVEVSLGVNPSLNRSTFNVRAEIVEGDLSVGGSLVLADGQRIDIGDSPVVLGRLEDCTIMIEDQQASRHHAQIQRHDEAVWVLDLNSTNGTKVNGARITQHRLVDGDVITIGSTAMRFEMD